MSGTKPLRCNGVWQRSAAETRQFLIAGSIGWAKVEKKEPISSASNAGDSLVLVSLAAAGMTRFAG